MHPNNDPPDLKKSDGTDDPASIANDYDNGTDHLPDPDPEIGYPYELLANERRRHIIRVLATVRGEISLRDLADRVAAREYDTDPESLTGDEHKRVYVACYRTHVPKFAKAGVVVSSDDRSARQGPIVPTGRVETLVDLLDHAAALEDGGTAHRHYDPRFVAIDDHGDLVVDTGHAETGIVHHFALDDHQRERLRDELTPDSLRERLFGGGD